MGIFLVINVYITGIFYDKDVRDERGIGCSGF